MIRAINVIDKLSSMISEYQIEGDNMRVIELPMTQTFIGADYEAELNVLLNNRTLVADLAFVQTSDSVEYVVTPIYYYIKPNSANEKISEIDIYFTYWSDGNVKKAQLKYTSSSDTYTWTIMSWLMNEDTVLRIWIIE